MERVRKRACLKSQRSNLKSNNNNKRNLVWSSQPRLTASLQRSSRKINQLVTRMIQSARVWLQGRNLRILTRH